MLADGRSLAEVVEIARRVFGFDSVLTKSNAVVQTLVVLKNIKGPWLAEPKAYEIRRVAREVVRGGPA